MNKNPDFLDIATYAMGRLESSDNKLEVLARYLECAFSKGAEMEAEKPSVKFAKTAATFTLYGKSDRNLGSADWYKFDELCGEFGNIVSKDAAREKFDEFLEDGMRCDPISCLFECVCDALCQDYYDRETEVLLKLGGLLSRDLTENEIDFVRNELESLDRDEISEGFYSELYGSSYPDWAGGGKDVSEMLAGFIKERLENMDTEDDE